MRALHIPRLSVNFRPSAFHAPVDYDLIILAPYHPQADNHSV